MSTKLVQVSNKGKIRVEVRLPEGMYEQAKKAASSIGVSLPSWLNMAISAYVKRWKLPTDNEVLWDRCSLCGKRHDPVTHGLT